MLLGAIFNVFDSAGTNLPAATNCTRLPHSARGKQGQCAFNKDYAIANISEWAIMPKSEDALAYALWKVGPIPVSINAAPKSFQLYSKGIYDDEATCDNSKVNHAMLLLGYTKDYWILKNWWGGWGEEGYMRLARGKNLCGISNYAGYVTV
uniref:Peptidase C1A papain C-terminal domain-containing protein n=1 Tax=Anopheles farauti TaxID=69004 RepID=A0A182QUR5_9DIPT